MKAFLVTQDPYQRLGKEPRGKVLIPKEPTVAKKKLLSGTGGFRE